MPDPDGTFEVPVVLVVTLDYKTTLVNESAPNN